MQLVFIWFGALVILLALAGSVAFAFTDFMDERLYGPKRLWFSVMLLAYAIYRGFRLKSSLSTRQHED